MPDGYLNIALIAIAAVLIFFMFRNSRKRKRQLEEVQQQMVPGAEVMTNFGLFGTLKSVDEVSNVAELETSPGVVVKVHRQTLAKVVTPLDGPTGEPRSVEEAMAIANREAEEREAAERKAAEKPAYGERITPATTDEAPAAKAPRRSTKKTAE